MPVWTSLPGGVGDVRGGMDGGDAVGGTPTVGAKGDAAGEFPRFTGDVPAEPEAAPEEALPPASGVFAGAGVIELSNLAPGVWQPLQSTPVW